MSDLTNAPAAEATPLCDGQLELFRPPGPRVVISYARPDGGPLTDADFEHLARLARAATTTRKSG
ncbi:hypothetical protein E6R60_33170 [Streptomyces sp. A0642]|uniref:hypothetical protein n=1 Tax=Streptomyces sp. A0642 TaxID=2563100 RepID=UPI0010A23D0A|nr:hypothetical protein [Streptomyces sp. A0642]THA65370.1 hypothetical protein E6R60_33170 [Streptomyces sp. A0642]